jgi:hypothetical protein
MPWFVFHQNNSGGFWDGPRTVAIEAHTASHANGRAEDEAGIYFHGVSSGRDCQCCGSRWYPCDDSDAEPLPTHYGTPLDITNPAGELQAGVLILPLKGLQ